MFSELEKQAEDFATAKESRSSDLVPIATRLVDGISSPTFILPLKKDALSAGDTTTYVYENSGSYPALFAFIAEVLHTRVPVEIRAAKFGPGEIIVKSPSKDEADSELAKSVQMLRELVRAKRSEMASKYTTAT